MLRCPLWMDDPKDASVVSRAGRHLLRTLLRVDASLSECLCCRPVRYNFEIVLFKKKKYIYIPWPSFSWAVGCSIACSAVSLFLHVVRQRCSKLPVSLKTLVSNGGNYIFGLSSVVDNSPHHSCCPRTKPLSVQTVHGSSCVAFSGTIAGRLLTWIVRNIYKGWYFQSVFIRCKSFSPHYHAVKRQRVRGVNTLSSCQKYLFTS